MSIASSGYAFSFIVALDDLEQQYFVDLTIKKVKAIPVTRVTGDVQNIPSAATARE